MALPYGLRRLLLREPTLIRGFHRSSAWAARRTVQSFKLADIGEGITECEVIKWSVQPSSTVQAFDPLCEVQSDKASVELTSPFEGVVKELLVKEGEIAKVGADLCLIEVEQELEEEEEETRPSESSEEGPSEAVDTKAPPNTQEFDAPKRRPHPLDPNAASWPHESHADSSDVLALPSVRHYAKSRDVDIAQLAPGSGKGGRVEKADVNAYLAGSSSAETGRAGAMSAGEDVVVELGRTRYNMWKAMVKSLEIPQFGYSTYLDLTNLHTLLPLFNAHIPAHYLSDSPPLTPLAVNPSAVHPAPTPPHVPPTAKYARMTHLPYLLKALARAMRDWPLFRSSISPAPESGGSDGRARPTLTVRPHADISIALSTPNGLYTPTLQRADTHSAYSLASQLAHLAALGRRMPCGLTPAELPRRGGTLTVSNVGAVGAGEFAQPALVPGGGVAIVAVGRARWIRDEERSGERRLRVGVSWSADHRVVEGAELAAFVECWRGWVERPERMAADGV